MSSIFDRTIARSIHLVPRTLVRRVASRYVAGETIEEAVRTARELNSQGCMVTMDLLGEDITTEEEASQVTETYLTILDTIKEHGILGNVSVKPTAIGLATDVEHLVRNARAIAEHARKLGSFVRIDMEDSPTTDRTLAAYRALRKEGLENIGVVLQAMLHRTPQDLADLQDQGANIRLCKGIYDEPAEVAHRGYDAVNEAFLAILRQALSNRAFYIGVATHDDPIIEGTEALVKELGLEPDQYEFQMLLGVRPEVRQELVKRGHRVRVYVPYGTAWYAYSVRRLKENPKFAGFITKDVLRNPKMLFGEGEGR